MLDCKTKVKDSKRPSMKELITIFSYSLGASFSLGSTSFLEKNQMQNKADLLVMVYGLAFVLLLPIAFFPKNRVKYPRKWGPMFNCLKLDHLDN